MRVTDRMIFDMANHSTARARERAESAMEAAATGVAVLHPWDDVSATGLILGHREAAKRFHAIAKSSERAADELNAADQALSGVGNILNRAKEIAVQMSNETYSAAQRASLAAEVDGLTRDAIGLFNSRFGNRYLFGGFLDGAPPFNPTTGAYAGDTGVRQVEIAPGVLQDVSIRGDQVARGVGGGTDLVATLRTLSTSLAGNSVGGVRATLDNLSAGITQVASARSRAGSSVNALDVAAAAGKVAGDNETASSAKLTDADAFDAANRLALANRALEAAISASVSSFRLTLIDKLR